MGVLAIEVLLAWSLVSFVTGLLLGAVIRRGERVHTEELLSAVFSTIESMQTSRSLNTRAV
jgi:hypothetical protein